MAPFDEKQIAAQRDAVEVAEESHELLASDLCCNHDGTEVLLCSISSNP